MRATLWRYTVREATRRPGRTLMTLAGIVIGVATVVAIAATTRATRRSYKAMFDEVGGKAALEITAPGNEEFDPKPVEDALENVEGMRAAVRVVQLRAGLAETFEKSFHITPMLVMGVDPARDQLIRQWEVAEGAELGDKDGVHLEAGFARDHSLTLNDPIILVGKTRKPLQFRVVGLLKPSGAAAFNGGAIAVMSLKSAQRFFHEPGKVNAVQLVLEEGADAERVRERVADRLPPGKQVETPLARAALAQGSLLSTDQALSALSVVSLVGGGFVILNAFLMNLGERRRQLAILRALGTTRWQLTRLLLREALLLGIAGTILGMGLGVVLARGMAALHERILGMTLPPLKFGAEPFILAFLFGPGLALAATIVPAWRAGRRSPLEAMRPRRAAPEAHESRSPWPLRIGLACVALCALFLVGGLNAWWPLEVNTLLLAPSMMLFLVGCVLILPSIIAPLLRVTRRLLTPLFGIEGSLAFRQLERQQTRTALTAGVLFIGVLVTIGFGSSLLANIRDIDRWYRDSIPADMLVRGTMPDPGSLWASAIPLDLGDRIRKECEGVAHAGRINFIDTNIGKHKAILIAREYPSDRGLSLALVQGKEDEVRAGLARGEVVIGTALMHRTGLGMGDELTLLAHDGERTLKIAGVTREYTVGGMVLYASWETANRFYKLTNASAYEVFAVPGKKEQAEDNVRTFCKENKLLAQSNAQLRAFVDGVVAGVEGFLWVLIALEFVVAALGIVNTLTMNVQEQTREFGILRAVGLKRGQVRKLVTAQAAALGLLSVVPGVLAGIILAWLMNLATYPFSGHQVEFQLRPGFVAACAALTLAVALLASLLPARRAARLKVIEALHYE